VLKVPKNEKIVLDAWGFPKKLFMFPQKGIIVHKHQVC